MMELNKEHVRIRYNGPAVQSHYIDVADLGSSLIALGTLCGMANTRANGEGISTKAMVSANTDQKCFELDLCLYCLSVYAHVKTLLGPNDIATAKEIFKWLGMLRGSPKDIWGLFQVAAYIGNREITHKEETTRNNQKLIELRVKGNNNTIYLALPTDELMKEPKAIQNMQRIAEPVASGDYDNLEFESQRGSSVKITAEDARNILEYSNPHETEKTKTIITGLIVYGPVYTKDAKIWKFSYGDARVSVDISETDIAQQTMNRGGTRIGDEYKVELEIRQELTLSGRHSYHYKILKVIEFREGPKQPTI
ncbi:MAG: hypothetical protein GDA45_01830 [Chromatiales bacterium]|nr:hypothetical protein [Chromatiales bacterium]